MSRRRIVDVPALMMRREAVDRAFVTYDMLQHRPSTSASIGEQLRAKDPAAVLRLTATGSTADVCPCGRPAVHESGWCGTPCSYAQGCTGCVLRSGKVHGCHHVEPECDWCRCRRADQ